MGRLVKPAAFFDAYAMKIPFLRWRRCPAAAALALGLLAGTVVAQTALRPELARPLAAAQEALKAEQAPQALKLALQARALEPLTPQERVWVERTVAAAALAARDDAAALPALEFLGQEPLLSADERLRFLETLAQVAQRTKDYPRLAAGARRYLAAGGTNPVMRLALLQALSLQGDAAGVVGTVQGWLEQGAAPAEGELRLLAASQRQLRNEPGYYQALKLLVARFPTQDYWIDLVSRIQRQPGFNARLDLDVYRLLEDVGGLDEGDDIAYMASLALKRGLPAEAARLVEAGWAAKLLGSGAQAAEHAALRTEASRRRAEDDKQLPALQAATSDAAAQAELAELLASRQQWAQANTAYARALGLGGVKREAELRLHHGVSLYKAGQRDAARAMLATVQGDASAMELAALWALRAVAR